MRTVLIGNSHAAMLIAAHRADPRGETLTVFAKPGLTEDDITLDGSVVRATSTEMADRLAALGMPTLVDLADADGLVIAGLAPSAFAAVRLAQAHSIVGWPSGQAAIARDLRPGRTPARRPLMSRPAYRAALTELTAESLAARLLKDLRRTCPVPAAVVPQPFPSEAMLEVEGKYPVFRRIARDGDGVALAEDLNGSHRAFFDALPRVTCLPQPADTLRHGFLTAEAFMRSAPRLNETTRQDADDVLHGNVALGARILEELRATLGQAV